MSEVAIETSYTVKINDPCEEIRAKVEKGETIEIDLTDNPQVVEQIKIVTPDQMPVI